MNRSASQPGAASVRAVLKQLSASLHAQSGAGELGLDQAAFAAILESIALKHLPASCGETEVRDFYSKLRLRELALARACAAGNELAWERFLLQFREKLYDVARRLAREDAAARELADSIYADLFGVNTRGGERVCKLSSYTGRGSLEGWLRSVLAQEYVNRYRVGKRLVSFEEQEEAGVQYVAPAAGEETPADPRLAEATDRALAGLDAEDRFVLAAYYLDDRTLAEIARMLGRHESSISRRLDKIVGALEKKIRELLLDRGLSPRQVQEMMQADVRDLSADVRAKLTQDSPRSAFLKKVKGVRDEPAK
jgi:RNA polymerase sigma-70 factor (ECF subfamily)